MRIKIDSCCFWYPKLSPTNNTLCCAVVEAVSLLLLAEGNAMLNGRQLMRFCRRVKVKWSRRAALARNAASNEMSLHPVLMALFPNLLFSITSDGYAIQGSTRCNKIFPIQLVKHFILAGSERRGRVRQIYIYFFHFFSVIKMKCNKIIEKMYFWWFACEFISFVGMVKEIGKQGSPTSTVVSGPQGRPLISANRGWRRGERNYRKDISYKIDIILNILIFLMPPARLSSLSLAQTSASTI